MVCVDYGDLLSVTLPCNRHHFDEVMVVTTPGDTETISVAKQHDADVFTTTSFYDDGAEFNKWKGLEEGLDVFGRHGLMALLDADIIWPKAKLNEWEFKRGYLHTPRRRMLYNLAWLPIALDESQWHKVAVATEAEWPGYSQIFHADDPHLPTAPWHELNWRHAGGADSNFQRLWPAERKVRPTWSVMHLGLAGLNWCGRSTPRLDGTQPEAAEARRARLTVYYTLRRYARSVEELYAAERLPKATHPKPPSRGALESPPR